MIEKLKLMWAFTKSFEGSIILVSLILSPILYFFLGYKDVSFILSIIGFLVSCGVIFKNKLSELKIIDERLNEFEIELENVLRRIEEDPSFSKVILPSYKINEWKNKVIKHAKEKLSRDIKTDKNKLIRYAINEYLQLIEICKSVPQSDFLKYLIFRFIYPLSTEVISITDNYLGKSDRDRYKKEFLSYVYIYFYRELKDVKKLFDSKKFCSDEELKKAVFFLKGVSEEVESIMKRISELEDTKKRNRYLEKLNEELREYLHTKGVSIEKYGHVFLSELPNTYIIFHQKLREKIINRLEEQGIKYIQLTFTGPYFIVSDKIKSTQKFRELFGTDLSPSVSHNLLIVRTLPHDSFISMGIDEKSKRSSKRQIIKIRKALLKIMESSKTTKTLALLLDKSLQEFVESLHYDFLIITKIPENTKKWLRENTEKIKYELGNLTGSKIIKLTDVYNISEKDLEQVLEKIGFKGNNLRRMCREIISGAKMWRYLLYGYGDQK